MKIINLLVAATILTTVNSFAAELDTYYLQQFGELAETGRYALKSSEEAAVKKCGMPLKHDLRRDWQQLASSTQKTLAKQLEKPSLAGEQIVLSNGGHFRIHYAASGTDAPPPADSNANSIPDWIEKVADVFEAVYGHEIAEMGYSIPPAAPYNVYLKNMSYFGLTDSDERTGQYPNSYSSYMTIENDFAEHAFQASIPGEGSVSEKSVKALQITAAHEFHHVIQFGINYYFEPWYSEAASSWMEDEVYDPVNQLYSYANNYLANTATSLNYGDGYSRWLFNRSIYEQLQAQLYPKDIIWKIWQDFAAEPAPSSGADIPMLPFIDKVLKSQGDSLTASFFAFAKKVYLRNWSSHSDEIANLDAVAATQFTADTFTTVQNPHLPAYSFIYYAFSRRTDKPSTLTLSYPDKPTEYQVVAFKNSDKSEYYYDESAQAITIPDFGPNDTIYLLICNNSTVSTTPPEPPASSGGGGGGGGGGGCFIATAAYGSYLHPEVKTLRDFRDRYLLTNLPGKAFVALYYRISPPVAGFIREHEWARLFVRLLLAPLIFAVKQGWLSLSAAWIIALTAFVRIRKRARSEKFQLINSGGR